MPKPRTGKPFELVVAEISRALDPGALVQQGLWIDGPDGVRNLDVTIEGNANGTHRRIHIECRDYDPGRGKIGIEQIDGLESKHRDMGFDVSILCSNAGFTEPARRKAKRSGLGLIGVLRKDDARVRFNVYDEVVFRRIDFVPTNSGLLFHTVYEWAYPPNFKMGELGPLFDGKPVGYWLIHQIVPSLVANRAVQGQHKLKYRFKYPLPFELINGSGLCVGCEIQYEIRGGWISQLIEIDATSGLYDWLRKTIRVEPGHDNWTLHLKNFKFGVGGRKVKPAPEPVDVELLAGEFITTEILDLSGFEMPKNYPKLDPYIDQSRSGSSSDQA